MPKLIRLAAVSMSLAAVLAVTACSGGSDAVVQGGKFDFVAPGGKTTIFYDPPASRGAIGDLTGRNLMTDQPLQVSNFAGKVVVINVWGSWCAPCRTETPELEKVYTATAARGVQFVGIDVRDDQDTARDFVIDRHVTYPSIFDPAMRSMIALGGHYPTSVVPTAIVLDRGQRPAAVFLKTLRAEELQPVVERVASEC